MLYLNDHIWDFDLDEALSLLSEQRREQALRFRHEQGRRTCTLAYLLLCEGLQKEYGITERPFFEYGEHGKPVLVGHPDIHFNMSHCREAVVCYVSDQPVGIDVEAVRDYKESLARHTMNDEEMALISASDNPALAFTRFWTMKEAVQKLSGRGLIDDMKNILKNLPSELTTTVSPDGRYVYSIAKLTSGQHT